MSGENLKLNEAWRTTLGKARVASISQGAEAWKALAARTVMMHRQVSASGARALAVVQLHVSANVSTFAEKSGAATVAESHAVCVKDHSTLNRRKFERSPVVNSIRKTVALLRILQVLRW